MKGREYRTVQERKSAKDSSDVERLMLLRPVNDLLTDDVGCHQYRFLKSLDGTTMMWLTKKAA